MSESISIDGSCAAAFIMLRPFCADSVPVNCCLYLGGRMGGDEGRDAGERATGDGGGATV